GAHRRIRRERKTASDLLAEGPIPTVDVEVVVLDVIIGHEEVGPAVIVQIAGRGAQSEPDGVAVDAGLYRYVDEAVAIVAIEFVTGERITEALDEVRIESAEAFDGVVDEEHVEVAVSVVVEKRCVGGV